MANKELVMKKIREATQREKVEKQKAGLPVENEEVPDSAEDIDDLEEEIDEEEEPKTPEPIKAKPEEAEPSKITTEQQLILLRDTGRANLLILSELGSINEKLERLIKVAKE